MREPIGATADAAVVRQATCFSSVLADYWALTKHEVNSLILITTLAGFYLRFRGNI